MNYLYERISDTYGVEFNTEKSCGGTRQKIVLISEKNNYRAFKYISSDDQLSDAKIDLARAFLSEVNPPGALYV